MSGPARHKVSYIVPAPSHPVPLLDLPPPDYPRNLSPSPLVWPASSSRSKPRSAGTSHPQHVLGVTSLALDLATTVVPPQDHVENDPTPNDDPDHSQPSDPRPRGLLYSGARDGLIISWDLNLLLSQRKARYGSLDTDFELARSRRRSTSISWSIDGASLPQSDYYPYNWDPPPLGQAPSELPYEERWEINVPASGDEPQPPRASFRQCIRPHSNWINDIALCNLNQSVISASSDHTVQLWNPHNSEASMDPVLLGFHKDYVKCLASCRDRTWVASGSFDKQIKIWDLTEGRPGPIYDLGGPLRHSVYSLAVNPSGTVLAAGSPERAVKTWDPRSGDKITSKLIGHTDNIRCLLVSDDGRIVISGSSDSTVKVWDLAMNRTIDSYSYHSDSVWSLYSQHPRLKVFYSGDKSGTVCKVDTTGAMNSKEGECLVLCRDTDGNGINKIVASDDSFIWTANNASSIKCWKDVRKRSQRMNPSVLQGQMSPPFQGQTREKESTSPEQSSRQPSSAKTSLMSPNQPSFLSLKSRKESSASVERERPSVTFDTRPYRSSSVASDVNERPVSHAASNSTGRPVLLNSNSTHEEPVSPSEIPPPSSSSRYLIDGVPFESLVPLVPIDDPYAPTAPLGPYPHDDSFTLHSLTSAFSLQRTQRPLPGGQLLPHHRSISNESSYEARPSSQDTTGPQKNPPSLSQSDPKLEKDMPEDPEYISARQEYELREASSDAVPIQDECESEIKGRSGLIRSEIFNDRRHALTLNVDGDIALWDIVKCVCVGSFDQAQVSQAVSEKDIEYSGMESSTEDALGHEKKSLELVRSRIEGEATVNAWCEVDTRAGDLTLSLVENTCFDGELYVDETDLVDDNPEIKDDARLSLGRILLKSLFDGFVSTEVETHGGESTASLGTSTSSLALFGGSSVGGRTRPPSFISLPRNGITARTSIKTPGTSIAAATPAETPAIPPDRKDYQATVIANLREKFSEINPTTGDGGESGVNENGHTNGINTKSVVADASDSSKVKDSDSSADYFNLEDNKKSEETESMAENTANAETENPTSLLTPLAARASNKGTPKPSSGATSSTVSSSPMNVMSHMEGFAKISGITAPPQRSIGAEDSTGSSKIRKVAECAEDQIRSLSERNHKEQVEILNKIFSKTLTPCRRLEIPAIELPEDVMISVEQEIPDFSTTFTVYRGTTASTGEDVDALEMALPTWVLEYLLEANTPQKDPPKLSFTLAPWQGPLEAGVPTLPNGSIRLTANRLLRIQKAILYVLEKLNSGTNAKEMHSAPVGEDELEILCNDIVLPSWATLAVVQRYVAKSGGDVQLFYRRKKTS